MHNTYPDFDVSHQMRAKHKTPTFSSNMEHSFVPRQGKREAPSPPTSLPLPLPFLPDITALNDQTEAGSPMLDRNG